MTYPMLKTLKYYYDISIFDNPFLTNVSTQRESSYKISIFVIFIHVNYLIILYSRV